MDGRGVRPGRVVVGGAGIAGAAAATTLRSRWGDGTTIEVLERSGRAGGRIARQRVDGVEVETGASLFHSANRLLSRWAQELQLELVDVSAQPATTGIWDGRRFLLRTRGGPGDTARLALRYRASLLRAGRRVGQMVAALDQVYGELAAGTSWSGPAELLDDLGLGDAARRPADDFFRASGVGDRFVREFADAVSRNNYGQQAHELNALADLVSLAGAGLDGGRLLRVKEGNERICQELLSRAGTVLELHTRVDRIDRDDSGWRVHAAGRPPRSADIVLLAAPLELSGIEISGGDTSAPAGSAQRTARGYRTVHVSLVSGRLRPTAFAGVIPPDLVLTTAGAGPLLSAERVASGDSGPLYKTFSTEALDDGEVDRLFDGVSCTTRLSWQAYPSLTAVCSWPVFRLGEGLYHAGAMETAVSTMETQAIAGVAAANLAVREHALRRPTRGTR